MTRPSSVPNPQKKFRFLVNLSGLSRLRQRGTPAAKLPGKAGLALLTACLVLLTACGMKGEGISMEKRAQAAAALDPAVVKAQNAFGMKLHRQLVQEDKEKNVFLSPVSVSMALAMTYNGSAGETREAMSRTLGWEGWKPEQVNGGNRTMKELLEKSGKGIQLNIANSVWSKKGLTFSKSFLQTNREYYDAYVKELDFSKADAAPTINRWVKDKTNGKIPAIVDGLSPQDRMVLINAIYFKGTWKDEFSPSRTKEEGFRLPGGSTVNVPMMARSGTYEYLEEPGFQAIRLPYGEGQMDMLVILPGEGSSLEALHEKLWSDASPWQKTFGTRQGEIRLPRFELELDRKLNDALTALGMGAAFDPGKADFTEMGQGSGEFYISQVKHKTYLKVDEKGTEAAAVTSVMMTGSAPAPSTPFTMVVNRPFFLAIEDRQTGAWLFTGSVYHPEEK